MTSSIYPEIISGRTDQFEQGPWEVRPGAPLRGHASCDFTNRILNVPLGATPVERIVRAHELMHLRVSPHDVSPYALNPEVAPRALECAEELRVNLLISRLGFDVSLLADGSESTGGEIVAHNNDFAEAVFFYVAVFSTGAEKPFLRGIKKHQPDWAKALGVLAAKLKKLIEAQSTLALGSTHRENPSDLPQGYLGFTVPVARLISTMAAAAVPTDPDGLRRLRRSLEPGGRRPPSERFAELVLLEGLEYETTARRAYGRRGKPDTSGIQLRYPSRLLTDPYQRAFAKSRRAAGAIVVIDQSGSMDLPAEAIDSLLSTTPGVTVVGYSHKPGDLGATPNTWLIAKNGRRATTLPEGNIGNGVDAPALRFALSFRRRNEPVIWVTDGQVTDSNDHPNEQLSKECAGLVRRHHITMARSLDDAARVLTSPASKQDPRSFGRVGRALSSL